MIYSIKHWLSDCAIRKANNNTLTLNDLKYEFSTKFGKFSVPFYTVICEDTGFIISINGNHTHTDTIARAIMADIEKYNEAKEIAKIFADYDNNLMPDTSDYDGQWQSYNDNK
jgi:hypothetical protein